MGIICNPFAQANHLDFYQTNRLNFYARHNGSMLPSSYRMFEFNYAFKRELENIFWVEYESPPRERGNNQLENEIVYNAEEYGNDDKKEKKVKDEEKTDRRKLSSLVDLLSAF